MTPRNTKRQRLERAGWLHVSGWLPRAEAEPVAERIDAHASEAERIGESGQERRGRPRKAPTSQPAE